MATLTKITRAGGATKLCSRKMKFYRENGRIIAKLGVWDCRSTDYEIEINADELIAMAVECVDTVNANNGNACPTKLTVTWASK